MYTIMLLALLGEQASRSDASKAQAYTFLRCEQLMTLSFKGDVSSTKDADVYIRFDEAGAFASGSLDDMAWRVPPADASKMVTARVIKFAWMETVPSGEKVMSRTLELNRASGTFSDTAINRTNLGMIVHSGPCTRIPTDPFANSVNKF